MKSKNNMAFTLTEMMIVSLIITIMITVSFGLFSTGQGSFFTSDAKVQTQESLRKVLLRVGAELKQTQVAQQNIFNNTGVNGTDIIRFSVPVICHTGDTMLDANANVAHWGAATSWGCTTAACMDADNNCATVEYKYIEYRLNSSNQLLRQVLAPDLTLKKTAVMAENITDFQAVLNGKVITLTVTAQKMALNQRMITVQASTEAFLRN